jgi:protein-S-isoprenylcysteine O-methyltransferase Ste14
MTLSLENRIPPPVVGALVALFMWSISGLGPRLPITPGVSYLLAGLFAASGLTFDLLGILAFRASRTTINPLKPERASALVTGGVYRVTRNPMYVGMTLLLLAWACYLAAVLPFVGPILLVLYLTRFQIQAEEKVLRGIFGEAYSSYAARVRRWL